MLEVLKILEVLKMLKVIKMLEVIKILEVLENARSSKKLGFLENAGIFRNC